MWKGAACQAAQIDTRRLLVFAEDLLEQFEKSPAIFFMEPAQFSKHEILLNCSYDGFDHGGLEKARFLPLADRAFPKAGAGPHLTGHGQED